MEPWRSLLQELADVLETEFAKLQKLERLAEGLGADSADAAFGRAATVPPKPTSLPCSPYTRSEEQVSHLESSWVLAKALPSLPSVAADEEDLNSDAVDDVTRSIKSFVTQSSMGSAASAQRGRSERTHFRVVRATKSCRLQKKPWYVINPDQSKFAGRWQALVACCLLFVALVTPVQVALLEPEFDWIFLVGIFVDAVFAVDLFLQFITAYPVTTPQGITWEIQASKIRSRYLKSWFGLDILSILPFDVLTLALEANELRELQALKVIRALRLMKLLRLMKTSRALQAMEAASGIFCRLLSCHVLGTLGLWAMALTLENSSSPRWIDLVQTGSYTITSVGYGDISPQNNLERMICTAIVLFSGLAWAYIIGEVGAIVADMTSEGQDFRRTMHHLNSMMKRQGLGFDLQCRLRRYFLQNRHQALTLERQSLMSRMSPQLQSTFCIAVNHRWLQKVTFLRKFMFYIREQVQIGSYVAPYEACMAEIAKCLRLGAFAQQETFDNVQVLYILSKGLVVLNSKLRSEGEVWGEDFVLEDTSLILPVAGYAVTYLETLSLNREDFMSVIERPGKAPSALESLDWSKGCPCKTDEEKDLEHFSILKPSVVGFLFCQSLMVRCGKHDFHLTRIQAKFKTQEAREKAEKAKRREEKSAAEKFATHKAAAWRGVHLKFEKARASLEKIDFEIRAAERSVAEKGEDEDSAKKKVKSLKEGKDMSEAESQLEALEKKASDARIAELDANERLSVEEKATEILTSEKESAEKTVDSMSRAEKLALEKAKSAKKKLEVYATEQEALRKMIEEKEKAESAAYKECAMEMAKALEYGKEREKAQQTLEAKTTEEKAIEAEIATLQQRLEDIRKEKETAQILATLKDAAEKTSFQRARGLEKKATKIATEKRTSTETLEKLDQSYEVSSREAAEQEAAALQASKSRVAAERRMQEKEGDAPRIVEAKDAVKKSRSARSAAERRVEEAKKRIQ
ncbi:KCNH6, partial [Symbiodinium necroappetens]